MSVSTVERPAVRSVPEPEEKPRDPLIEAWENAPALFLPYEPGKVYLPDGSSYTHRGGKRLIIQGEQVMDTSEYPWAKLTVDMIFEHLKDIENIDILEFGLGLRVTANRFFDKLIERGRGRHTYTAADLCKAVLEDKDDGGLAWRDRKMKELENRKTEVPSDGLSITIDLRQGEAEEEADKLIALKKRYHVILADLYPVHAEDRGLDNLKFLNKIMQLQRKPYVFSPFLFAPGSEEQQRELRNNQLALLQSYFDKNEFDMAEVNPPTEYRYLLGADGIPIRKIPAAVFLQPKDV